MAAAKQIASDGRFDALAHAALRRRTEWAVSREPVTSADLRVLDGSPFLINNRSLPAPCVCSC
jgi:hypothetical protein